MPFLKRYAMTAIAIFASTSIIFATGGAALAEEAKNSPDPVSQAESILMEGVDPAVAQKSDEELFSQVNTDEENQKPNIARDLIVQKVTELKHNHPEEQKGLRQALDKLVAPTANLNEVREVMADKELQVNLGQSAAVLQNLPVVDDTTGGIQLTNPNHEEHKVTILPKDAVKTGQTETVVQSKNKHTGVESISQVTDELGGQVISVLNNPDTPYVDFKASMPSGYTMIPEQDGTITIRDTMGNSEGKIDRAWAVDSKGKKLPTSYEVMTDGTVRQHINTAGAAFPIVADPSWWWWTKTVAKCAAELALLLTPLKVVKIMNSIRNLASRSRVVQQAIRAFGSFRNASVAVLKQAANNLKARLGSWGRFLPSFPLTASQRAHAQSILAYIGTGIFELIGLGGCWSLVKQVW